MESIRNLEQGGPETGDSPATSSQTSDPPTIAPPADRYRLAADFWLCPAVHRAPKVRREEKL